MPETDITFSKSAIRSPGSVETMQFVFKAEDFTRIRELIYKVAGISLSPAKKDLVYSRLARRLRARRLIAFADYIRILESGDGEEWEAFINALTTNMTSFFREPHHFPILARHIATIHPKRTFNIWSSASSTGEEPYSIAMTMVEHFNSFEIPVKILATDIDTNVLEKARLGIYPVDQVQKLSVDRIRRFFLRGEGENTGFARIKPELRKLVSFMRINLLDDSWPLQERFDAIFCRNVMIYFDKPTQYALLKKMSRQLQQDGLFFAGHSENFQHATDLFRLCGKTVYALQNGEDACRRLHENRPHSGSHNLHTKIQR